MNLLMKKFAVLLTVVGIAFAGAACTSGGDERVDKFAAALQELNEGWQLYEVKDEGGKTVIKVEVGENVTFQQGETAKEALLKIDPNLEGYIEFYNSQVGMTLRKVEIFKTT